MMPHYLYNTPAIYRGERVMIDAEMLILSYPPHYSIQYASGRIATASVRDVEIVRWTQAPPMQPMRWPNRDA